VGAGTAGQGGDELGVLREELVRLRGHVELLRRQQRELSEQVARLTAHHPCGP
jgi:hypothetical protein